MNYLSLGLGNKTSLITDLSMTDLGRHVSISCLYDPMGDRLPYRLLCKNCSAIRWQVIDADSAIEPTVDLIGLTVDVQDNNITALIMTDAFELSIICEQFEVDKHR